MQKSSLLGHKVLFSRREFSSLTGLSLRTIAKLIASREVKSILVGRRRLIPRAEIDRFIKRDHRISAPTKVALLRRSKKRKDRKLAKKQKFHSRKKPQPKRSKKKARKNGRAKLTKRIFVTKRGNVVDPRLVRGLGLMRRERVSASEAARREGIKLKTFVRGAGRYLYRSGTGKPWKVRSADQLRVSMSVLTDRGRKDLVVRNSRERALLHKYELALHMFRVGEDGAEEALKAFERKKVARHTLVTSVKLLIELEEAGQLDFDSFYTSIGGRS